MSATEVGTQLVIPEDHDVIRAMPSRELFALEQALPRVSEIVTEACNERVRAWTEAGWTQQRMADEIGCTVQAVNKRCQRLGIRSDSPRGRPRNINPVEIPAEPEPEPEIVDAEPVEDPPVAVEFKAADTYIRKFRTLVAEVHPKVGAQVTAAPPELKQVWLEQVQHVMRQLRQLEKGLRT